jgi:hypothetical protein
METKFNFKSAICTSREQSERLLALGLRKETADMGIIEGIEIDVIEVDWEEHSRHNSTPNFVSLPAWSLHRLIEMMPDYIVVDSSSGLNPNFYLTIRNGIVSYKDNRGFSYGSTSGSMYDAITSMISFLIKEGYFNKEYLV